MHGLQCVHPIENRRHVRIAAAAAAAAAAPQYRRKDFGSALSTPATSTESV